jgi:RHS repeat-associated protein
VKADRPNPGGFPSARLLLALVLAWLTSVVARAELVTMHVSYTGGSPVAFLQVSLATESVFLSGPSAEGSQAIALHPDEAMLVQVVGDGIGDYRITFTPPPPFGTLIDGSRRAAHVGTSATPRPLNHPLQVTMVRRERVLPASTPLGQASSIAWHPPKVLGAKGPYIEFNVGQALNGDSLPPLRIPLLPRGTEDEPLPFDLPDSTYNPLNGGFTLVTPQVVVRLSLDPQSPGFFWVKFHGAAESPAFAAYHFQFPVWPGHWSASRQARVVSDRSASGSAHNYETNLTGYFHWSGMVQTAPTNTWTLSDWRIEGQPPLRTLLGKREGISGGSGNFGEWFVASTVTDTTETKRSAQDTAVVERRVQSYRAFDRWLTEDPLEGIQTLIAPHELIEGSGSGSYVTRYFQDPRAQTITGSEAPSQYRTLTDASLSGRKVYETWLNSSPSFNPAAGWGSEVTPNGSAVTTVTYESASDLAAFQLPRSIIRTAGTTTLARTEITYTVEGQIIAGLRKDYASPTEQVTSVVKWHRPDATNPTLRSRPRSLQNTSGAKQSYAYKASATELQIVQLSGTSGGGTLVEGLPDFGAVDPLHLIPLRSTKTVETFRSGRLTRRETWVYLGGGGAAPVFNNGSAVAWETFDYTADGRLMRRTGSNNTEYTANWAGSRKLHEADETGLRTLVYYDAMDRVIALEREAAGGIPTQATSFTYDAANRVRYHRSGPIDSSGQPSGEQLSTEHRYDLGGRLTHRIEPGGTANAHTPAQGITTAYSYTNGDRDVVAVRADGNQRVIRFVDGRVRSFDGTAVVTPKSYTYTLDDGGRLVMTTLQANQRPTTVTQDWLGRTTESRASGPIQESGLAWPIATTHRYDSGGLLAAINVAELSEPAPLALSAERAFEYDEFGSLKASGLNLDGVPGLQEASSDRLTVTESKYYLDSNSAWWLQTTTKLYHTTGSAAYHTSHQFIRLTQFASGQTSQVDHLDFHNNRTSASASFHPLQKARIVTSQAADATKRVTTTIGGLVLTEQILNDAGSAAQPTVLVYDAQGRLRQSTSPRGIVTRHDYYAGTHQRRQTYEGRNEFGQEIAVARIDYDANGRVAAVTDAHGRTTTTSYYPTGQIMARGGDAAHPLRYIYNAFGQVQELWTYRNGPGGSPDKTLWSYDANTGWPTHKTDAAGRTVSHRYSFSAPYRLTTRLSPRSGLTTTYKHRLDTGELAVVDYSDATPDLTYTYTRTGQMDTVGDITGVRDYLYDRERLSAEHLGAWHGGLVLTSLPDDTTVQNTLTNRVPGRYAGFALGYVPVISGVPQTQDMAREMKVALGYDDFGRPSTLAVSHGGQTSAAFAYDYTPHSSFWRNRSSGLFRQERTPEANRDLLKDSTVLWGSAVVTRHIHTTNDAGELASIAQHGALYSDYGDNQGTTSWTFGYSDTGELTSATSHLGATNGPALPGRSYAFDYDTAGNRKMVGIDAHQASYVGEPNTPGANAVNQVRQRQSLPGRVTGTAHADATINVAGSGVGRLNGGRYWDAVLAGWGRYAEFSVSALRNGQLQSGSAWRQIRPEWETLDYDEEGNLIADSLWRYHYDAENRLVQMTTRSANELSDRGWQIAPPARELNFKYDHLGRRVEKTVRKNGIVTFNRRFVYAGWNLIAEFELANGVPIVRRSYAWGLDIAGSLDATGGIGALVLQTIHQGSARSHYHVATDGHGSVTALLDSNGTAVAAYEYDPFGQPLRAEGATAPESLGSTDLPGDNPFRYSNKYWDRETGLYDYGLRFYDPSLGRFINRDPIGESGGNNLYAFAGNNPVNRWDYLGLDDRARRFGPEIEFWGPTPDSPGEDGSYRGRGRVDIRDSAEIVQHWGTDSEGPEVVIGLTATGALPRVGIAAAERSTGLRIVSSVLRYNPLALVGALLAPTPMGNSEVRIQRGFLIPENANPNLVAEYFVTSQSDPERANRILLEIWSSARDGTKWMYFSRIPFGFSTPEEFAAFTNRLNIGLVSLGMGDVQGIFQGSAVTGVGYRSGLPFDVGRTSDFDIALAGKSLLDNAAAAGIDLRSGGLRTGPLREADLAKLGLLDLAASLSSIAGRPVNFMIYASPEAAIQRSSSIPMPRP